jgi:hypothetical protein
VDHPAPAVDDAASIGGEQRLPGIPATVLGQWQLDRVAEPGRDDRVGVEEEQEVVGSGPRSGIAGGAEAEVRAQLE